MKLDVMRKFVVYTQESMEQRLDRVHNDTELRQLETVLFLAQQKPTLKPSLLKK